MGRRSQVLAAMNISSPWTLRVKNAIRYKTEWENRFKCDRLESYYEGFQWQHIGSAFGRKPYTLNLVYATIKRKIGGIVYTDPEFVATVRPGRRDWSPDFAIRSVELKQNTLNTIVGNPNICFVDNIRLAALDSFFRFAVIETGYAADWRNPQKPKIEMASHTDPNLSETKDRVISDEEVLEDERIFSQWISARRFYVSTSDNPHLRNCNWCGYYSFMTKDVLANTKGINFPTQLRDKYYSVDVADATQYFSNDKSSLSKETLDAISRGEVCKVWNIWDNVTNERLLLLDGSFDELYATDYERLPFSTYRFDLSLKGWYPIPPVFQWLSPQDEINESREQMRRYRRRFTRKFEVYGNADPDELDKFKSEEDGEIIQFKKPPGDGGTNIRAISNPEIGISISEGLVASKDDFNIVASNTVARGRGSDRQTATASKIQNADEELAQSIEQIDFSRFICAVGREMLLQMGENFEEGLWVKINNDPDPGSFLEEYQMRKQDYKYVTAQEINDGYDFDLKLNVINGSPAQMAQEEASFVKFLTLVRDYPEIRMSPTLIREAAYKVGYKNEKVIAEYQKMAMLVMMEKAALAQQSLVQTGLLQPPPASNAGRQLESGQPNAPSEIAAQMEQQV